MELPKKESSTLSETDSISSTSVEFMDMSVYRTTFEVNYFGLVETIKAFLPLLRKNNGGGRIIMNTSLAGFLATHFMSAYDSSKFAVEGFSDSLRRELLPHGVSVSILEPGYVLTPILAARIPNGMEPYRDAERKHWKTFFKECLAAPSSKVTSDAVIHAMRSESPRTRYHVGKGSIIYWLVSQFPTHWVDYLIVYGWDQHISEEDLSSLAGATRAEFEL
jgi:NAD(P)-dependent dehydrogenase (short-subunit alcohol dehydrogenase family)